MGSLLVQGAFGEISTCVQSVGQEFRFRALDSNKCASFALTCEVDGLDDVYEFLWISWPTFSELGKAYFRYGL